MIEKVQINLSKLRDLHILRPMARRNFALYWVSWTLVQIIQTSFVFSITFYAFRVTRDPVASAIASSFYTIPLLVFMVPAGLATDRVPRRTIIIAASSLCAAVLFLGAIVTSHPGSPIWFLYLLAFLMGLAISLTIPVNHALMPTLVPREELVYANALNSLVYRGARVGGAALGSVLIQFVPVDRVLASIGCLAVVSIICLYFLESGRVAVAQADDLSAVRAHQATTPASGVSALFETLWPQLRTSLRQIRDGFLYAVSVPWVWSTVGLYSMLNVFMYGPLNVGLPILAQTTLPGGLRTLDIIYLSNITGVVVSALTIGRLHQYTKPGRLLYGAVALQGLGILLVGTAGSAVAAVIGGLLIGTGAMTFGTTWSVLLQSQIPQTNIGRVASFDYIGSWIFTPLGFWGVGVLISAHGPQSIFVAGSVLTLAIAFFGMNLRSIRALA